MVAVNAIPAPVGGDYVLVGENANEAWQGIAGLKLRLADTVNFYWHRYRGTPWLIIADRQRESYFRCSANAEQFLNLLDGTRSVEQAYLETRDAQAPGLQRLDIILLIANLQAASLLQNGAGAPVEDGNQARSGTGSNPWLRPFAIRIPLFDPDRMLRKTLSWYRPLFNPLALLIWSLLLLLAVATAWLHWEGLVEHSGARFADPKNLLWYWLLYPLVKAMHELGHACATRVRGGEVREMGIMLLVFFPVPYVDSSAAHRFASRNQRLLVSAAGIMVEVGLASLALLLWVNTEHGLVHDLAFDVVVIAGLSTLLFNANPLLRFDGYYILGELIEIPNLGTRSNQYLGYLFKRYILGIPGLLSPVTASGEAGWLIVYGVCARIYRVFISLVIAVWVAGKFLIIGVLLALWAVITQLVYPAAQGFYRLIPVVAKARRLARFSAVLGLFAAVTLAILFVPGGYSTYAEGVVSLPEDALVRAGADGVVTEVLSSDGAPVEPGATILKLENLALEAKRDMLIARLEENRARQQEVFLQDRSLADILKIKVSSLEADLRDVQDQLASLHVTSKTAGVLSLPMASDMPGRYVFRGEAIGYVAGPGQMSALVAIPQLAIDQVRRQTETIEMKLSNRTAETFTAKFLRELPQGTDQLPSRMLGSGAGGEMAVDARDAAGVQVMSNIFLVEVALPPEIQGVYLGQRIYLRFNHRVESLANRLLRRFRQFRLQAPFV